MVNRKREKKEERRGKKVEKEEIQFVSSVTGSRLYQLHLTTIHTNIMIIFIKWNSSEFSTNVFTAKLISEPDGTLKRQMCVLVRL